MSTALSLPDLDAMDHAALKALLLSQQQKHLEQQDIYRAEQEKHAATLSSRMGEIERLLLLVEKLQRMLFGTKSEKVLRQIEQLELQLEELHTPAPLKSCKQSRRQNVPLLRSRFADRCLNIFRVKSAHTCPTVMLVQTVVASFGNWVKMPPRCWSTFAPASRSSAMCVRS